MLIYFNICGDIMENNNEMYKKVYDFTNENVACLKDLYHFENSKVLSVVGSGDQCLTSILNGAKKVDLFDINQTSYLYFVLKFYAIRELSYEEFYDFFIEKNIGNLSIYKKIGHVLPIEALKYYEYLFLCSKKRKKLKNCFRKDSIDLLCKDNQLYYFNKEKQIIPYLIKENYYKLQDILKRMEVPNFYHCNIIDLKKTINDNYDIMLLSNIYNCIILCIEEYTRLLKKLDIPEIQACYDWFGVFLRDFIENGYSIDVVAPSSPYEYSEKGNYVYSLRK